MFKQKYRKRSGEECYNTKESILLLAYTVKLRITEGSRLLKIHIRVLIMVTFLYSTFLLPLDWFIVAQTGELNKNNEYFCINHTHQSSNRVDNLRGAIWLTMTDVLLCVHNTQLLPSCCCLQAILVRMYIAQMCAPYTVVTA